MYSFEHFDPEKCDVYYKDILKTFLCKTFIINNKKRSKELTNPKIKFITFQYNFLNVLYNYHK